MPSLVKLVMAVLAGAVPLCFAPAAVAETQASAPPGGGLPGLEVTVDLARGSISANGATIPIGLEKSVLPAEADVVVEPIAIGKGKNLVHVRVPAKDSAADGPAWEAILAGGRAEPLFAGTTGLVAGDPGERTGQAIQIIPNGETSFVLVGDLHEEVRLCSDTAALLNPRAIDASSLELRPGTPKAPWRLSAYQRQNAVPVLATDKGLQGERPLARLLVAVASSTPDSRGSELTDGDLQTAWSEERPGEGQGEFVVMAAPRDVPIARVQVVASPSGKPAAQGAAPKNFYLVTASQTFRVTLPEDAWNKPGEAYEVVLPSPVRAACMALVLDGAYSRGLPHPQVRVAELVAFSEFDAPGKSLDDVAKTLSGERGIAAAQVLERAGEGALAAVSAVYKDLDSRGRALAVDVAASHPRCEEAAPLLSHSLCETEGEAPRKAREKLERCPGAVDVLAGEIRQGVEHAACVAPMMATLSPEKALAPIADALSAADESRHRERAILRSAFARALESLPRAPLSELIGDAGRSVAGRLEIMRAAGPRVAEATAESDAAIDALMKATPPMGARYLVLGPLGELAKSGDVTAAKRIEEALSHDDAWPIRARAAELSVGLPDAAAALVAATRDAEPRVREVALAALSQHPSVDATRAAMALLHDDGWSFVKAQAVAVLVRSPADREADDALGGALDDTSPRVRGAAAVALGQRRALAWRGSLRDRLDDKDEEAAVRAEAAWALGSMCDVGSADRLTELARGLANGDASEEAQQIGLAALVGLATLRPPDLKSRLAPLAGPDVPAFARSAAQRALALGSGTGKPGGVVCGGP